MNHPVRSSPACPAPLAIPRPRVRTRPSCICIRRPTATRLIVIAIAMMANRPRGSPWERGHGSNAVPRSIIGRWTVIRCVCRRTRGRWLEDVDDEIDQTTIEGPVRLAAKDVDRLRVHKRGAVGSPGRERVVHVSHSYDSRSQWNAFSLQPVGITASIQSLVVVTNDHGAFVEKLERRDDLGARERMTAH